jgi:hydrogenase expression/formation protein HypC
MCVGIPGRVVDFDTDHPDLAMVDVSGMARPINLGLLSSETIEIGDWVVIHMGFALEKMTAEEASEAIDVLRTLGQGDEGDPAFADLAFSDPGAESEPPW